MPTYFIYKIYCLDENIKDIYIGSTMNVNRRRHHHKKNSLEMNEKKYIIIRDNGGWDNWKMVCIEELPEYSRTQAQIREEELRVSTQATLNSKRCYATPEQKQQLQQEYKQINHDLLLQKHRDYNLKISNNQELRQERNLKQKINKQKWRENNPELYKLQTKKNNDNARVKRCLAKNKNIII